MLHVNLGMVEVGQVSADRWHEACSRSAEWHLAVGWGCILGGGLSRFGGGKAAQKQMVTPGSQCLARLWSQLTTNRQAAMIRQACGHVWHREERGTQALSTSSGTWAALRWVTQMDWGPRSCRQPPHSAGGTC